MPLHKIQPRRVNDPELGQALEEIYNMMNQIVDEVNSHALEARSSTAGKPGSIRVTTDKGTNKVYIEAKSDLGWYGIELGEMNR